MNNTKLFNALTRVDAALNWLLKGGLALTVFSALSLTVIFILFHRFI